MDKDEGLINHPPKRFEIKKGFKVTGTVDYYYHFGRWYHKRVHVVPLDEAWIRKYPDVYEQVHGGMIIHRCEYAGAEKVYSPFIIPEYVRVFNEPVSVFIDYEDRIHIGKEIYGLGMLSVALKAAAKKP